MLKVLPVRKASSSGGSWAVHFCLMMGLALSGCVKNLSPATPSSPRHPKYFAYREKITAGAMTIFPIHKENGKVFFNQEEVDENNICEYINASYEIFLKSAIDTCSSVKYNFFSGQNRRIIYTLYLYPEKLDEDYDPGMFSQGVTPGITLIPPPTNINNNTGYCGSMYLRDIKIYDESTRTSKTYTTFVAPVDRFGYIDNTDFGRSGVCKNVK